MLLHAELGVLPQLTGRLVALATRGRP